MRRLKSQIKTYLVNEHKQKIFGEGPYLLLKGVEETGSLRKSAANMSMAYTKAHRIIKAAEDELGVKLLSPTIGGSAGGGSVLTPQCKILMSKYEQYRKLIGAANEEIYHKVFGLKTGCVIMASGQGKRFGSNKLLAKINGKPMFTHILETTEGLFDKRVVVTVHNEIADYCKNHDIECILHQKPFRSDVVRLGTEYLGNDVDVCTFCLSDQPFIKRDSLLKMLYQARLDSNLIYRMSYSDEPGNPVTFPKELFNELMNLPEKKGGNFVASKYPERVRLIEVTDEQELMDIDTVEDMDKINGRAD